MLPWLAEWAVVARLVRAILRMVEDHTSFLIVCMRGTAGPFEYR